MRLQAFVKIGRKTTKCPKTKRVEIEEHVTKGKVGSYFLIYYDDDGGSFADSYHETVENAKHNAHYTCGVEDDDWEVLEE